MGENVAALARLETAIILATGGRAKHGNQDNRQQDLS
jgi:hypothetical protein